MKKTLLRLLFCLALAAPVLAQDSAAQPAAPPATATPQLLGFQDASAELALEQRFLAVPDPARAREHLRTLTAAPHVSGSAEDRATAEYVARKFREAGLETRIDSYRVWMSLPREIRVEASAPPGLKMRGPSREHVEGDPYQDDPRILMPYNAGSPSGEVEAEVVYANYGRPEDFRRLKQMGVEVRGRIVIARYGQNFRGVKALAAQEAGAAALILYSDPVDDGYFRGDAYPTGPYRPATGVQRGSVEFTFEYPGDPTTPGIASTLDLPDASRTAPEKATSLPRIPVTPLSYGDAAPLLEKLGGPESPREWQGALPFTYHVGSGPVRVRLKVVQQYSYTTIWNVIGTLRGSTEPESLVVAGNHRDAWVYGAVDPSSGTAAMLEAVHGVGELVKSGWRPRRTIVFASWDGEEQGLIGSTEYCEQYSGELQRAVAYFNMDVAVSGPEFGASTVPSLKPFLREIARAVPSPAGGSLYEAWRAAGARAQRRQGASVANATSSLSATPSPANPVVTMQGPEGEPAAGESTAEPRVGDLGSGSDYSAFLQHLGVPSTDIGSHGPYGVYHSAFDNFAWFSRFADPSFAYEQQMARFFGLEALRMAQAERLPLDYQGYGEEVRTHLTAAERRARELGMSQLDFASPLKAAAGLTEAAHALHDSAAAGSPERLARTNAALLGAEHAMLGRGLPHRPWFRHTIYAPGEYTGYSAVVLPGVNEALDRSDAAEAAAALQEITLALERAAAALGAVR